MKPQTKPVETEATNVTIERVKPDPYMVVSFCPDALSASGFDDGSVILHLEESFWFNDVQYVQEVAKVKLAPYHAKRLAEWFKAKGE